MARCQECDSQVAANDVFCPFCGVRLEEPAAWAEESDVSPDAATEPTMSDVPIPQILADMDLTADYSSPRVGEDGDGEQEQGREPVDLEAETAEDEIPEIARELNAPTNNSEVDAEIVDIFEERAQSETGISKPLEELAEAEPPRSMFDSVRIMEPGVQRAPDTGGSA